MKNWILAGALLVAFNGYSIAGLEEARAAARAGDFKRAIQEALPDAQRGDPEAQSLLGAIYDHDLEQFGEAMKWYRRASDQGKSSASGSIGLMYFVGLGVKRDYAQAMQWFRKEITQGGRSGPLFRTMGLFYAGGHGVQLSLPLGYALTQFSYKFDTNPKYDNGIEAKMNRQQLAEGKKLLEQLSSSDDILATIDRYAGTQGVSNAASVAPENSRMALQGGQTWTGQYRCAQGLTPFTIQFARVTPTADSTRYQIEATFSFGGQGLPSGSYGLSGVHFPERGNFQLEPTHWIQRPPGYFPVGLSGSLKSGSDQLTGKINHRSCADFQLALQSNAREKQPAPEPGNRVTDSTATAKSLIDYLPPARDPEDQTRRICRSDVRARITDRSFEQKFLSSGAEEIIGDWARRYYAPGRTHADCPKINQFNALIYWNYAIGASNMSGAWTNEDVDRFIAERQKAELAMRNNQDSVPSAAISRQAQQQGLASVTDSPARSPETKGEAQAREDLLAETKLAKEGNAAAQFNLGLIYEKGEGVPKDDSKAFYWYQKAAEQGDPDAQNNLGSYYGKGIGVAKDPAKAVFWYRKAAEQGYAIAQGNLGSAYLKGRGVPRNAAQAIDWYRKAAQQGLVDAQLMLAAIYALGEDVPKDPDQEVYWVRKAAEQGNAKGQYMLGRMYISTNGQVPNDERQGISWLIKSADQGYTTAMYWLGVTYDQTNIKQAISWYRKAAELGDAEAQTVLGLRYANGTGVPKDYSQAAYWWRKAAAQGHVKAKEFLSK